MKVFNLRARPDKYQDTIELIEKCFGYKGNNSFKTDFYPLVKESNLSNCWAIEINGAVAAHAAASPRRFRLNGNEHTAIFIGGVVVDPVHRGEGLSSRLLEHIFKTYPECFCYMLWSDKVEMYKKRGFQPCVGLYEHPPLASQGADQKDEFVKASFSALSEEDFATLRRLYETAGETRVFRSKEDWKDIKEISSARVYVKRDSGGKLVNYFIKGKGQDLQGIIHEYGNLENAEEIRAHGKLWTSKPLGECVALYGCLARPGKNELFAKFIGDYTDNRIIVKSVGGDVRFIHQNDLHQTNTPEFLQGIFGPGQFAELNGIKPLFISGMDSV